MEATGAGSWSRGSAHFFRSVPHQRLYYAHILGGWVSQPDIKSGTEYPKARGSAPDEALHETVSALMAIAAIDASEEL